jgi:hypothetical protein
MRTDGRTDGRDEIIVASNKFVNMPHKMTSNISHVIYNIVIPVYLTLSFSEIVIFRLFMVLHEPNVIVIV